MIIKGFCHPPLSSERREAELDCSQTGQVTLRCGEHVIMASVAELQISPPLGALPASIGFADGWQFKAGLDYELAEWVRHNTIQPQRWVHRLERNWLAIVASVALVVVLGLSVYRYGIPAASHALTRLLPQAVPVYLGEHVLETLDEHMLSPSQLDAQAQWQIQDRFALLQDNLPPLPFELNIVFRSWPHGPNAFALSDGTVVVLDSLVEMATTPAELDSILLHEVGHVYHQHVMESVVQSALISVAAALIVGDSSGMADMLTSTGVFVASSGYSRDAEREADQFAAEQMLKNYGTTEPMAAMFNRFMEHYGDSELPEWLQSHPELEQRIQALK
ncbi:M48 family metallopeptidase [Photobacterium sp. TLY01]|uniref:M48 family metallopeptidase n=1 Tax=Photobacterium sp. TLY01 TaxID=2907534 RepID=UPI001F3251E8|nr:M48 family metallopeptidase [Photobacterium sp. TLY01]UIP27549.1 M48 family metallopeptidase [Photobacterium sp. TLY01]